MREYVTAHHTYIAIWYFSYINLCGKNDEYNFISMLCYLSIYILLYR